MNRICLPAVFFIVLCFGFRFAVAESDPVVIGSKAFTEGYVTGEWLAQHIDPFAKVTRRFGMGGTGLVYQALKAGSIDMYVEYTGTINEAVLKRPGLSRSQMDQELKKLDLIASPSLGFNNTYAIAVTRAFIERVRPLPLKSLSDLAAVAPEARTGFSHEFMERSDGVEALSNKYGLHFSVNRQGMAHSLAFTAAAENKIDLLDVYSTDADIERLGLVVLDDDRKFFPPYEAVVLARREFAASRPDVWQVVERLKDDLNEAQIRHLNAEVDIQKRDVASVVRDFLSTSAGSTLNRARENQSPSLWRTLIERGDPRRRTHEHLNLVGLALLFSLIVGLPLGVLANQNRYLGQSILLVSGLLQTIPSLALLCFLVPLFGIGTISALIALCLYGLLPIVMNTFLGLNSIDPSLIEMARALKLTYWQRLTRIELPLAVRPILVGVRTSTVISIGTATLAALIGAGGYGATIMSGLAINDNYLILAGAVPAAVMALLVHGLFEILEEILVPKGIRKM